MDNAAGFRILFRVQIGKALYTQETSLDTYFDGHPRLLNLALINSDRHAQILLAFSAVEAAAQTRP